MADGLPNTSRLYWGSVALMPDGTTGLPYTIEASSDGTNWGNPDAVVTAVQSRLQDGSLAVVSSYANRQAPIHLRVTADTYDGLAAGEAALVAETDRDGYNTLTWTPNIALAVPTVFDVVYGVLTFDFDDYSETVLKRRFVATLTCLPFPRSATEVVATAPTPPPSTPVVTSVDTGAATTGWTGVPGAATVASGAVTSTVTTVIEDTADSAAAWDHTPVNAFDSLDAASSNGYVWIYGAQLPAGTYYALTRTASFATSATPYIAIDVRATAGPAVEVFLNGSGIPRPIIASSAAPRAGFTRLWVQASASTTTSILLRQYISGGGSAFLQVDQIVRSSGDPTVRYLSLTRAGSVTGLGTTPYLMIDYNLAQSGVALNAPIEVLLDGVVTQILSTVTVGSYKRVFVKAPGSSVSSIAVRADTLYVDATTTISVDQIQKTDAGPASGTRRQLTRTLPVAGTMRTQGRLAIQHETSSLGEVLAYVYRNDDSGYLPPLRPYYFAGGSITSDTTLVSGGSNMLDTLVEYRVPAAQLVAGNHRLAARLKGNSAGTVTLNVAAYTRIGSTDLPGTTTFSVTLTVATTWAIYDLGGLALPSTLLPSTASGAIVRLTIVDADTSGIDIDLDEAWLFNLDIGTLTHVDCGTGTPAAGGPSKRLWLDPATVTNDGQDTIYRGHAADRSDAFHPADTIKGWTPPIFEPDSMNVFTVTTNALDAAVELRHYPRWLHHARDLAA